MKGKQKDTIYRALIIALLLLLTSMIMGMLAVINLSREWEMLPAMTEPEPASETVAPTPEPTPPPTPEPTPEPTPALRKRTDLLILVNPWNSLPEGYEPQLELISEEESVDTRCADALRQMMADCEAEGNAPYICSGYRTMQKQEYLYNNKIYRLIAEGVDEAEAPAIAARSVAVPGTSEHQLGLAVDIIDYFYPNLDEGQEDTSTQQWLMENSWRYGFILRYPNGKSDITGIIYEPWHYRYVGKECAQEIYELGVTLEEYLEMFYEPAA